ncbi:hypothetical protein WKK05_12140 [Nostoc sp. UHCC 0302]|uniref:hypothetical protein n=1 Tax=Nostoc sp. UHCC 0302 TaxID=3134896 RepID=UPI00311C8AA0
MDMQSALTLTIVVIFWAFITLIMFQFITGLFVSADGANNLVSVSNVNVVASTTSVPEVITPQVQTTTIRNSQFAIRSSQFAIADVIEN